MSSVGLLTPILNGGIQNVNFVTGRILTAADLTAERTANLQRQRLLGVSAGAGVATGFETTLSSLPATAGAQVVQISAGVAVNLNGDVIQLPSATNVALTATPQTGPGTSVLFAPCAPPQTQLTNPGIYVLTVMPASGYQGQAPVTQVNSNGVATSCTSQYATTGVQFRLAQVTLASTGSGLQPALFLLGNQIQTALNNGATPASLSTSLSLMQNGMAYVCFGVEDLAGFAANPFPPAPQGSPYGSYGLIDSLRASGAITPCEVPLAMLYWTPTGVQFLDMWSVRRRLTAPLADDDWPLFVGNRHGNEAEAIFLQFQNQLRQIAATVSDLSTVTASQYFTYLPPVGVLPLAGAWGPTGFNYQTFFGQAYHSPVYITGDHAAPILRAGLTCPPIYLATNGAVWLYQPMAGANTLPYLIFTSIYAPFQGQALFDVSLWDYANFT